MNNKGRWMKRLLITIVCGLFTIALSSFSQAEIPKKIGFQGKLTDAQGNLLDGTYSLTFKIYDAETGGTKLWEETQSVSVSEGLFSVYLGDSATLNLDFDEPYWLEITVEGEILSPRKQIAASGYAYNATKLDDLDSSQFLRSDYHDTMNGNLTIQNAKLEVIDGTAPTWTHSIGSGDLAIENDIEVDGTIYGDSNLNVAGNATIAGNLTVSGTTNLSTTAISGTSSDSFEIDTDDSSATPTLTFGANAAAVPRITTQVGDLELYPAGEDVNVYAQNGLKVINDATATDTITIRHDDTDGHIATTVGDVHIEPQGNDVEIHSNAAVKGDCTLKVYDSDDTDYIQLTHDSTNAKITSSAGDLYLEAAPGATDIIIQESDDTPANLILRDSGQINLDWTTGYSIIKNNWQNTQFIYTAGGANKTIDIGYSRLGAATDLDDAHIFTGTGDLHLEPAGGDVVICDSDEATAVTDTGIAHPELVLYSSDAGAESMSLYTDTSADGHIVTAAGDVHIEPQGNDVEIHSNAAVKGDCTLKVYDSDDTDYIQLTHDSSNAIISNNAGKIVLKTASGEVDVYDDTADSNGELYVKYSGGAWPYTLVKHDGTNGTIYTAAGDLYLYPSGGEVIVDQIGAGEGNIRISGDAVNGYWETEANPRWELNRDMGGASNAGIGFGPGGATALDTKIYRTAAYQLRTTAYQLDRDVDDSYFKFIAGTSNSTAASWEIYGPDNNNNEGRFRILIPNPANAKGFDIMRAGDWAQIVTIDPQGATVFNVEADNDADFQVKGDTDDNTFYVDTSADSVGIGTATPGAKLEVEVADTANKIGLIVDQNDTTNNPVGLQIENAGTGNSLFLNHDNTGTVINLDQDFTGGVTAVTSAVLDVDVATSNQTADLKGLDINLSTGVVDLAGAANAYGIYVDVSGVDDQSSGAVYPAYFTGGPVMITDGTHTVNNATANGDLFVDGDLEVDGTLYAGSTSATGTTADTFTINSDGTATTSELALGAAGSTGGKISTGAGNLTIDTAGGTIDIDDGTIDLSTQTVDVTLNNAVDALNFDGNTLSIDASQNRVGIGTAAPSNQLEVFEDTAGSAAYIRIEGKDDTSNFCGLILRSNEATPKIWQMVHVNDNTFAIAHHNGTSWTETPFTIATDNKVGIGETSPGARLEVDTDNADNHIGLIVDQDDVTNNPVALQIENVGTGNGIFINQDGNGISLNIDSEATTANIVNLDGTALTTGEAMDITATFAPADGSTQEGIDLNFTHTPTASADTFRGIDLAVTEGANALANTLYGAYVTADNSANTSTGTHSIYGGYFSAASKTAGTTTAYGIYATASGADTNYAGYFETTTATDTTPALVAKTANTTEDSGVALALIAGATGTIFQVEATGKISNPSSVSPTWGNVYINDKLAVNGGMEFQGEYTIGRWQTGAWSLGSTDSGTAGNTINVGVSGSSSGADTVNFNITGPGGDVTYNFKTLSSSGNDDITIAPGGTGKLVSSVVYNTTVGVTNRDVYVDDTGVIGYVSSSIRYKDNVTDMEDIAWLYDLRPVNFTYKNDKRKTKQYGLIAEEVEKINPSFVSYDKEGRPETVRYSKLIPVLIKSVQEQKQKIKQLEVEINALKEQNELLLKRAM